MPQVLGAWDIADVVLASGQPRQPACWSCTRAAVMGMMNEGVSMTHPRFNYHPRCPKTDLLVVVLKPNSDDASVTTVVLIDDPVSGLHRSQQCSSLCNRVLLA
jgi:hypothetical protein